VAIATTIIIIAVVPEMAAYIVIIVMLTATTFGSSMRKIIESSVFRCLQFATYMMRFVTASLFSSFCDLLLGFQPTLRTVLILRQ